ncbi:hypothetical protein K461DRAFT_276296 [Myriangium duriaei CBS 260.36]|uniref:Uncharacterized protein n=1 Tax=Myriangium duriaei CBS 260.36 TaxID=1168546 RepID=A0A9P4MME3_9PEZI|nr:hypothetical protein K461DRAFT_276296 [Myriangium duriaei CBS 260.36]
MANPMQIPGLFLQQADSIAGRSQHDSSYGAYLTQPESAAQQSLPLLPSFTSSDTKQLRAAVQHAEPDIVEEADSPNDNGTFTSKATSPVETTLGAEPSGPSDREEGELTDASMDISSVAYSPVNERKRKARSPADESRATKVAAASGVDNLRAQRVQAQQIIATLIANGFPVDQLIQDISGIAQARRKQTQPHSLLARPTHNAPQVQLSSRTPDLDHSTVQAAVVSPSSNLKSTGSKIDDNSIGTTDERSHESVPLLKAQPKPPPAKTKSNDSQAYKSRLEALKKVSQGSKAESALKVKTKLPQVDESKTSGTSTKVVSDTNSAPSSKTTRAQKQLDMGKLQMRIAALRAENASKQQAASVESTKNLVHSGSATPDPESTQDKSPSHNFPDPYSTTKGRLTALDLIEVSDTGEVTSVPETTPFKSPMGIDQQIPMIIEASSSENTDDEHDSSDKLEMLTSDIALLNARIAAKMREREQSSKSPADHGSPETRIKAPSQEYQGTISQVLVKEATNVVDGEDHTASAIPNDEACGIVNAGSEPELIQDGSALASRTRMSPEASNTYPTESGSEMSAQAIQIPHTDLSAESSVEQIAASSSASGGDAANEASNGDDDDDDDAPMSIDSGDYPTPEPLRVEQGLQESTSVEDLTGEESEDGDESVPMDISDSSSEDYEPEPPDDFAHAESGAVANWQDQPRLGEKSDSDISDDGSEDEYDPELTLSLATGVGSPPVRQGHDVESPSSDGSNSRSPTPEGGWRKFPQVMVTSGVTIRDESGIQPDKENVVLSRQHISRSFTDWK